MLEICAKENVQTPCKQQLQTAFMYVYVDVYVYVDISRCKHDIKKSPIANLKAIKTISQIKKGS